MLSVLHRDVGSPYLARRGTSHDDDHDHHHHHSFNRFTRSFICPVRIPTAVPRSKRMASDNASAARLDCEEDVSEDEGA